MPVWQTGRTRNISRTGLEFAVAPAPDRAPPKDDPDIELRLELPHPDSRRAEVMARGRVTRVVPNEEEGALVAVAVTQYLTDFRR